MKVTDYNYYKILGVNQNASPDEIRSAFRFISKRHRPSADEEKYEEETPIEEKLQFVKAHLAYDILSDEDKRREHDEFLRRIANKEQLIEQADKQRRIKEVKQGEDAGAQGIEILLLKGELFQIISRQRRKFFELLKEKAEQLDIFELIDYITELEETTVEREREYLSESLKAPVDYTGYRVDPEAKKLRYDKALAIIKELTW